MLEMTCGDHLEAWRLSTEEGECAHQRQPTRTSHAHMRRHCSRSALRGAIHGSKKRKKKQSASPVLSKLSTNAISYNARFRPRPHQQTSHHDTRHHQRRSKLAQGLRNNQHRLPTRNSQLSPSGSQKLLIRRSPDPVCASRPAKKNGRLFCRGVAAIRHQ